MAITINQAPTYPNVSYTNLLYAVSSDQVNNPQFQYVMDIRSGSGAGPILSRIKQFPNPAGAAIFDPSRIINDYLEYDTAFDKTGWWYPQDTEATIQKFTMEFGEEYADSISGSVVLYDGNGNPGAPNVSDSTNDIIFPGIVDPNNGTSYNWQPTGSAILLTDRPDGTPINTQLDTVIISAWNGTVASKNLYVVSTDENGTPTGGTNYPVTAGYFLSANIGFDSQYNNPDGGLIITYDGVTVEYPYASNCNYDRVNFAFINNYGFWDTYGINLPQKKDTSIKRNELIKPFVDYSSATSQYNLQSRGATYFQTSYQDKYEVVTDWLSQEEAEWLSQLLESPEVFVQTSAGITPIILTNSSYRHNTNRRSQKNFQYTIEYKFSNQRRTR